MTSTGHISHLTRTVHLAVVFYCGETGGEARVTIQGQKGGTPDDVVARTKRSRLILIQDRKQGHACENDLTVSAGAQIIEQTTKRSARTAFLGAEGLLCSGSG